MHSPVTQQQSSLGGLDDAFSGLNFNPPASTSATKPQQQPKSDPFASFNNAATQRSSVAAPQVTSPPLSGGGFFDAGPKLVSKPAIASKAPQVPQANLTPSASNDFGDFSFASAPAPASTKPAKSASNDLFDFSEPAPLSTATKKAQTPTPASAPSAPSANINSAFNLSAPAAPAAPSQPTPRPAAFAQTATSNAFSSFSNNDDPWGSNDAWATPEPSATTTAPKPKSAASPRNPSIPMSTDFSAWGGTPATSNTQSSAFGSNFGSTSKPTPKVTPDEDFGGWSSAAPATPVASNPPPAQNKPAGGGQFVSTSEDLFSNVWE